MEGMLRFLDKSPPPEHRSSKKCFPSKLFGVSQEAPSQFKLQNTLVNLDGYMWRPPNQHYLSQMRYHSVVGGNHISSTFSNEHKKRLQDDASCFKKKKGLLSQFLDKHAWKRNVIPILGTQRSPQGRSLKNIQLSKLRSESHIRRSSFQNINMHYSLKKGERSSLEKYIDQAPHLISRTTKLNPIEAFETHFTRTPLPSKSKSGLANPEIEQQQNGSVSFLLTSKSKGHSTNEDELSSQQGERLIIRRKHDGKAGILAQRGSRRRSRV